MIYDKYENAIIYFNNDHPVRKALDFVQNFNPDLPDGKYEIDGDNLFAIVISLQTKLPEGSIFESHRKYADIQTLIEGIEYIDVSIEHCLEVDKIYSEEIEAELYKPTLEYSSVILKPGYFAVLYPDDWHRPGRAFNNPSPVRKIVVKMKVS